tara:strand:+ start:1769 stop:2452 length:684 start_codon:yes stop_codon:yes gene_type:complete
MAINYETLLPDILPMVIGCPDSLIESTIRASAIDFCERTGAYQLELDPITTVANVYEYDLEAPTGTTVHKIMWVTFNGTSLEPVTSELLEQRKPKWRDSNYYGEPEYYVQQSGTSMWLAPVPNVTTASSVIVRAQLKPTHTSTACDEQIMNEYRDAIVNGALFRLLRMPGRDWSDLQGAGIYSGLFAEAVVTAERRARHADEGVVWKVNYGGIGRTSRRTRYGRERG